MKYSVMFAAVALLLGASGLSAQACNPLGAQGLAVAKMDVPASMLARNNPNAPQKDTAVGLWHVVHTMSDGNLLFEGFDVWHSDGTEEEIANVPPATGPICFGVWSQHGNQFQLLYHTTFTYDINNNFTGTIVLTETNKLARDGNSYKGAFEFKQFDPNGNLVADITGTSQADRLNGD